MNFFEEIHNKIAERNAITKEIDAMIIAYNKTQREIANTSSKTSCSQVLLIETHLMLYTDHWKNTPS